MHRIFILVALSLAGLALAGCDASVPSSGIPSGPDGKGDVAGEQGDPATPPGAYDWGAPEDPADPSYPSDPANPEDPPDEGEGFVPEDPAGGIEGAEIEPNDDDASANALTVPGSYDATITEGDLDTFAIELRIGHAVEIETIVTPEDGVDTIVHLYSPGGAAPLLSDDDSGQFGGSLLAFTAEQDGVYLLQVIGYSSLATGSYRLVLRAGADDPGPDEGQAGTEESEPNDASGQASAMAALPAIMTARLDQGDVDSFVFEVDGPGPVSIETHAGDEGSVDTFLSVLGTDGTTVLAQDDDSGAEPLCSRVDVELPAAGRYFVQVRGYDETVTGAYSVDVAFGGAAGQ